MFLILVSFVFTIIARDGRSQSRHIPGLCLPCELLIIVCRKLSFSSHSFSLSQVQVELVPGLQLGLALQQPAETQLPALHLLLPHLHDGQHAGQSLCHDEKMAIIILSVVTKVQILGGSCVGAPQEASLHALQIHQEEVSLLGAEDQGERGPGRDADTPRAPEPGHRE